MKCLVVAAKRDITNIYSTATGPMGIDRIQWILHFTLEELRYSESTPICLKAEHEDVCRMKCLVVEKRYY